MKSRDTRAVPFGFLERKSGNPHSCSRGVKLRVSPYARPNPRNPSEPCLQTATSCFIVSLVLSFSFFLFFFLSPFRHISIRSISAFPRFAPHRVFQDLLASRYFILGSRVFIDSSSSSVLCFNISRFRTFIRFTAFHRVSWRFFIDPSVFPMCFSFFLPFRFTDYSASFISSFDADKELPWNCRTEGAAWRCYFP